MKRYKKSVEQAEDETLGWQKCGTGRAVRRMIERKNIQKVKVEEQ